MTRTRSGLPSSVVTPVIAEAQAHARWADTCADLERRGILGIYQATLEYQEQYADGASEDHVAVAVTKAGFSISRQQVGRRLSALKALSELDGSLTVSEPSTHALEMFSDFLTGENRKAHVANNGGENEWYTPREYIEAAREVMGGIDLDPASSPIANTIVDAKQFFTDASRPDSLTRPWDGRVWMNPPYAQPLCSQFTEKLAAEYASNRVSQAITLTNNATETEWFQNLAGLGAAVCFPNGRVKFWHPERESAPLQGQALLYLGENIAAFLDHYSSFGTVWRAA